MINFLSGVATLWNLALLLAVLATLSWFLYSFALRRMIRARRIEGLRMKRLMKEAAERTGDESTPLPRKADSPLRPE